MVYPSTGTHSFAEDHCLVLFVFTKFGLDRERLSLSTWILCVVSAAAVGACGVLPLLLNRFVRLDRTDTVMQTVLSFAVGGLLGDVFLHLLPEAWGPEQHVFSVGVWVLVGLLVFMCVEKVSKATSEEGAYDSAAASGYLNLVANCTDNFTHGLAIAASYMASPLVGALTTLAIICHEIPHEVGDFAILLRSSTQRLQLKPDYYCMYAAVFLAMSWLHSSM